MGEMRAAFEKWYADNFNRRPTEVGYETDICWQAWQAARAQAVPNEHGKNRYGLDMAYFRNLFIRELNRPLVDFRPDELARVLARAARTADADVLREPEFQGDAEPVANIKAANAIKAAYEEGFDDGMQMHRSDFEQLWLNSQAKAAHDDLLSTPTTGGLRL